MNKQKIKKDKIKKLKKDEIIKILNKNKIKVNTKLKKEELMKILKKNKIKIGGNPGNNPQQTEIYNQQQFNTQQPENKYKPYENTRQKGLLKKMSNGLKGMKKGIGNTLTSVTGKFLQRRTRYIGRLRDAEAILSMIPNEKEDYAGSNNFKSTFHRNLWRNLKRNILLLASVPTKHLEELLLKDSVEGQEDFSNLIKLFDHSGFSYTFSDGSDQTKNSRVNFEEQVFK